MKTEIESGLGYNNDPEITKNIITEFDIIVRWANSCTFPEFKEWVANNPMECFEIGFGSSHFWVKQIHPYKLQERKLFSERLLFIHE